MKLNHFINTARTYIFLIKKELWMIFAYSFFINLLMLLPSLYMLEIFDRILIIRNIDTLEIVSFLFLILILFQFLFDHFRAKTLLLISEKIEASWDSKIFDAMLMNKNKSTSYGPILDLTQVRQFISGRGIITLLDLPWVAVYILVAYLMHPWLGHTAVIFGLVQFFIAVAGDRFIKGREKDYQTTEKQQKEYFSAHMKNFDTVTSHGMLNAFNQEWLKLRDDQVHEFNKLANARQWHQSIAKFARYSMQSLGLAVGAYLAIEGQLSLGTMVASNLLIRGVLSPIDSLVALWPQLLQVRQALTRVNAVFQNNSHNNYLSTFSGKIHHIEVVNLSVFKDNGEKILDDIHIELHSGQVTAIIGPSGAGKTTLLRALVGLIHDFEGDIYFNELSIKDFDFKALGEKIGYLSQSIDILDGTVAENIARFNLTEPSRLFQATELMDMHKKILSWPQGYETLLGQDGMNLSSGLAQRVALARAVYGNVELIALDEPNSYLDDLGEKALEKCIVKLKKAGKIVVLVSHRQSILKFADKIIHLEQGQVKNHTSSIN